MTAMRVVVSGSIATDHLMTFPGRFAESLMKEQLESVSLSFLATDLQVRRGGSAANIAFGMGRLGLTPVLLGAVGEDFEDYRSWLERHGVDTESVHLSDVHATARFVCTTDADGNQIATFYAGAMQDARLIELEPVVDRLTGIDLLLISPNDPVAMANHADEARFRGIPFVADPSQQLSSMSADEIHHLLDGAAMLFSNEYESALIHERTGLTADEILARVPVWVTTLGAKGARVQRAGEPDIEVGVVPEHTKADPTGVGDAFRAGFVAGLAWELDLERCAQIGATLAAYVIETIGTQEYEFTADEFTTRLADTFGPDAGAEVRARLTTA
ncbi:MAG: carbohydrate kinase family protein [Candidatus Nanopelagicales bacterium]